MHCKSTEARESHAMLTAPRKLVATMASLFLAPARGARRRRGEIACAAVNRYLNTPMKRHHGLQLAAQALDFVAGEG
jgi:hypothetical protein